MTSLRRSNSLDSLLDEEAPAPAAPVNSLLDALGKHNTRAISGTGMYRSESASVFSASSARSKPTRSVDIMGPCVGGPTGVVPRRSGSAGHLPLPALNRTSSGSCIPTMGRSVNSLGSRLSQPQPNVSMPGSGVSPSYSDGTTGGESPTKIDVQKVLSELKKPIGGVVRSSSVGNAGARTKSNSSNAGEEPTMPKKRRSKNKMQDGNNSRGGEEKSITKRPNSKKSLRGTGSEHKKEDPRRSRLRRKVSERHNPSPKREERPLSPKRSSSKTSLSGMSKDSLSKDSSSKSDLLDTSSYSMDGSSSDEEEAPKTWKCVCGFELEVCMKFCGMCASPRHWTCSECEFSKNLCVFRFCGSCAAPKMLVRRPSPQYLHKVLETSPASPFSVVDNDAL